MTLYDKGMIRAMKKAYEEDGYYVALTDRGVLIQTDFWGAEITYGAVPNSVKSLIVLHNGAMPRMNTAVLVQKKECASAILETVVNTVDDLSKAFSATGGAPIKPTRLTFDGMRVWQTTNDLRLRLVDVDDQQILAGENLDGMLVCGYIFSQTWFGCMYVRPQIIDPEDKALMEHMAQMQWISLDDFEE